MENRNEKGGNMVKKNIIGLLVLIFAFSILIGCGANENGGFDLSSEIVMVTREEGSGTRGAFVELTGIEEKGDDGTKTDRTTKEAITQMKTDTVLSSVSGEKYAIGYVSTGSLNDTVKALKIDGVAPKTENIKSGDYKLARPFNIATKDEISELAQDFIDFIMSKEGQEVVAESYISIDDNAAPYSGTKPSGKIVVAGSSSVTPVMEKLREAYLEINPDATIEVQQSDSTSGMQAAMDGTADIGMASRELKESEKAELNDLAIAIDGIAVIVNTANPLDDLSVEEVKDIYICEILTWSEISE